MMTERHYHNYMCDCHPWHIAKDFIVVTADTKENVQKYFEKEYPKMVVNVTIKE